MAIFWNKIYVVLPTQINLISLILQNLKNSRVRIKKKKIALVYGKYFGLFWELNLRNKKTKTYLNSYFLYISSYVNAHFGVCVWVGGVVGEFNIQLCLKKYGGIVHHIVVFFILVLTIHLNRWFSAKISVEHWNGIRY